MRRRLVAVAAAGLLAGCGVPTSGDPTRIPASEVPYGLASPTPASPTSEPAQTMVVATVVYFVGPEDVLVARGREVPAGGLEERLDALLDDLGAGPTQQERDEELSTALPPEVELDMVSVEGGIVTIDLAVPEDASSGWESRRAVGQIVLTATSVPEVRGVRLTRDGESVEAPLPDGELTTAPLTAEDYAPFLTPPTSSPTSAPSTTPTSAPPS